MFYQRKGLVAMTTKEKLAAMLLACTVIFGANASAPVAAKGATIRISFPSSSGYETDSFAQEILTLVNAERARAGVAPLRLSRELMDACRIRAREITQSFSHTRPNGQRFSSIVQDGYYTCGENISAGHPSAEETMRGWMNSPGHRANILNADYTELGVGYVFDKNSYYKHYWVQIFKRPIEHSYRERRL